MVKREWAELRYKVVDRVVQGEPAAKVAREYELSPETVRRWRREVIVRPERATDRSTDVRAAASWRDAPTPAKALAAFRRFLKRDEDHWSWEVALHDHGPCRDMTISAREDARAIVVCDKSAITAWLCGRPPVSRRNVVGDLPLTLLDWRFPASRWTARTVRELAASLDAPIGFFGDLDPDGVFAFAALRAGGVQALLAGGGPILPVRWLAFDDRALASIQRVGGDAFRPLENPWIVREWWSVVKRLVPDVVACLGPKSVAFLDSGRRLDLSVAMTTAPAPFERLVRMHLRTLMATRT